MNKRLMKYNLVGWFICRYKDMVEDIAIPLKDGADKVALEKVLKAERMTAARQFKQKHELHPCTKIDVELQAVMPRDVYSVS